jgi:hypothetical protein
MRRLVLLALTLAPGLAAADEIYVRGGGRLTGQVIERGPDSILVDIGTGRIGLPLSYVERIVAGATPIGDYRERAAGLDPGDVAGWLALGRWAREQELHDEARGAYETALAADPDNAAAHRALDHVLLDGQWIPREESYRARGYVPLDGAWVTPEERRAILEDRRAVDEDRRAADEEGRTRVEADLRLREAEARVRVAEVEARRAEADFVRAEAAADRSLAYADGLGWAPWYTGSFAAYSYAMWPYPYTSAPGHSPAGPRRPASSNGSPRPLPTLAYSNGRPARLPTLAGPTSRLTTPVGRASGRSSR